MPDLSRSLRIALISRFGVAKDALDEDTALFSEGLVDSMSVIELVTFLESEIGLPVPPDQITLENFDSIAKIAAYAATLIAAEEAGG